MRVRTRTSSGDGIRPELGRRTHPVLITMLRLSRLGQSGHMPIGPTTCRIMVHGGGVGMLCVMPSGRLPILQLANGMTPVLVALAVERLAVRARPCTFGCGLGATPKLVLNAFRGSALGGLRMGAGHSREW